jgi:hypothetical protein
LRPTKVFTAKSILVAISIVGKVIAFSIYSAQDAHASILTSQNLTPLSARAQSRGFA